MPMTKKRHIEVPLPVETENNHPQPRPSNRWIRLILEKLDQMLALLGWIAEELLRSEESFKKEVLTSVKASVCKANETLETLKGQLGQIITAMARYQGQMKELLVALSELKQQAPGGDNDGINGRLFSELQHQLAWFREDQTFKAKEPLSLGLIHLHERVGNHIAHLEGKTAQAHYSTFLGTLKSFRTEIEQVLNKNSVEVLPVEVGCRFDPDLHRCLSIVAVARREQDGQVVEVASPAFKLGGKVVKLASVMVGRYQQKEDDQNNGEREDSHGDRSGDELQLGGHPGAGEAIGCP